MLGTRCGDCGEVRWKLMTDTGVDGDGRCPVCGGETREERRHPGRSGDCAVERRDSSPDTAEAPPPLTLG